MNGLPTTWLFVILTLLLVAFFLPKYGILVTWRRRRAAAERARIEDALKLLWNREWENRPASLSTLKAGLGLSDQHAFDLVTQMSGQGLVVAQGSSLVLTHEGERLAIQITRAHRLLERYLADEARMPLKEIHQEADRREHKLTPTQVDDLEASLGYPARDPHGDPIPTHDGQLPRPATLALTSLSINTTARVVHIEDEPAIAFAQILAEGVRLGQTLRVLQVTPSKIVLADGENEYRLAPVIAANIQVEQIDTLPQRQALIPLHQLADRQEGEIIALDDACQGFTRRRFLDLGLTPGTAISPELLNAFGDPRAYRVRGTLIALRKDQANQIWVRPRDTQFSF